MFVSPSFNASTNVFVMVAPEGTRPNLKYVDRRSTRTWTDASTSSVDRLVSGSSTRIYDWRNGVTSSPRSIPSQVSDGGASRSMTFALDTVNLESPSRNMVNISPKAARHVTGCDNPPDGKKPSARHGADTRNRLEMVARAREAMPSA